ncbi:unnamed protein product (macronuclear) [Paramecium tetraurelia]|uniref:Enkurin domain-containing protein n=1 Tax=Paramecium tetraurelia TaxID=5888 RepID=A0CZY5_PARTE|nr:uncharacterized protein GSPATT00011926001 [Paramecium tetraurelia]CAK76352.1 unnamed protein product [Paramecium tetraurelia]|eukprot:XP_001443749.1 hypothetical protein (macronuclear) [Paramecium tetraurelia strain d4-2]
MSNQYFKQPKQSEISFKPLRNVRPSGFLNSFDLLPQNYYTPLKISGNKFTKQNYNLQQKPASLDPIYEQSLPKIEEKRNPFQNNENRTSQQSSVYTQVLVMNSDLNRRIKTEIDEQNDKISKLLKCRDKRVQIVPVLDLINQGNKLEHMGLDQNEQRPKRKINRQLTNGRLLKLDP